MLSRKELYDKLRGGLFLSSMMGSSNGSFCAQRGKDCVMVQLGAYLAEPPAYGERELVLPPKREDCIQFFAQECAEVRRHIDALVCVNLATPKLEWGIGAAECFSEAGGDLFELNIHGGYAPYLSQGKVRAMVLPENRRELFKWLEAFSKLDTPIIVKLREGVIGDYTPILDRIVDSNLFGVHFNVRDEKTRKPDYGFVRSVKEGYDIFLLASGYVRSSEDARKLFQAGADMVGIAELTLQNPKFIQNIAAELK